MTSSTPVFGAVLALVAWRIYRRIRRNIGRQPLRPRRALISVVIFSILSLLLVFFSLHQPRLLLGVVGGLLPGVLLGWVGLRLTRFETTAAGHFYIPNTPIGIALSLLLVGRLAYRFMVLRDAANAPYHPPPMQSPLTFFIFGLMAGYYIVYQTGLFLHRRDKNVSDQKSFAPGGSPLDSPRDRS
jgi:MFS family permease